jgi:hypothetical protein
MKKISSFVSTLLLVLILLISSISFVNVAKAQNVGSLRTVVSSDFSFKKDLMLGDTDPDVKELQRVLNSSVDTIVTLNTDDVGSLGNEGTYFGPLTKSAVIKFQNKYKDSILTPNGLTTGTGNLDKLTRTKLNLLLGVMTTPDSIGLPQNRPSRVAQTVIPATTVTSYVDNTNSSTCRFTEVLISIAVIPTNRAQAARNLFNCNTPTLGTSPFVDLKINGQSGQLNVNSARNVTVTWTSANVTSCQSTSGSKPLSGSQSVFVNASGNYGISCTGPLGTVTDSVWINFGSTDDGDLEVSCEATPATTTINSTVIWEAEADGGTGSYRYEWAGDVSGSSRTVSREYSIPGVKTVYLRVTSGSMVATADCSARISSSSVVDSAVKVITNFSFVTPPAVGVIDENSGAISVVVPYGTNVTSLIPSILGTGASVSPVTGVAQNFTNPVTYTVTAIDGTTKDYVVTVTNASVSDKAITSFGFSNPVASGVIDETAHTIEVRVPLNTSTTSLIPIIVITGASVSPASGVVQNFTNPVSYTVSANNGSTQSYVVTVIATTTDTTASTTDLAITCEAKPSFVSTGEKVTWKAKASGGNGSYKYKWSGEGLSGSKSTLTKTYSSVGAKEANLTVKSGTLTGTTNCAVAVFGDEDGKDGKEDAEEDTQEDTSGLGGGASPGSGSGSSPFPSVGSSGGGSPDGSGSSGGGSPFGNGQGSQCNPGGNSGNGFSVGATGGLGYNSSTGWSGGFGAGVSGSFGSQPNGFANQPSGGYYDPCATGSGQPGSGQPGSGQPGSGFPNSGQQPGTGQPDSGLTNPDAPIPGQPGSGTGAVEDITNIPFGGQVTGIYDCKKDSTSNNLAYKVITLESCPVYRAPGSAPTIPNTEGTGWLIVKSSAISKLRVASPYDYDPLKRTGSTLLGTGDAWALETRNICNGTLPLNTVTNNPLAGVPLKQLGALKEVSEPGECADLSARITGFSFPTVSGLGSSVSINQNSGQIIVTLSDPIDLTSIAPDVTISADSKSVSPATGVAQNFNSPVKYTVTGMNGNKRNYTVTVKVSTTGLVTPPPVPAQEIPKPIVEDGDADTAAFDYREAPPVADPDDLDQLPPPPPSTPLMTWEEAGELYKTNPAYYDQHPIQLIPNNPPPPDPTPTSYRTTPQPDMTPLRDLTPLPQYVPDRPWWAW